MFLGFGHTHTHTRVCELVRHARNKVAQAEIRSDPAVQDLARWRTETVRHRDDLGIVEGRTQFNFNEPPRTA